MYTLLQGSMDGNTYLPMNELAGKTAALLQNSPQDVIDKDDIMTQIQNLIMDQKLVCKGEGNVYAASYYYEEQGCAAMLHDLNISEKVGPKEEELFRKRILDIEQVTESSRLRCTFCRMSMFHVRSAAERDIIMKLWKLSTREKVSMMSSI